MTDQNKAVISLTTGLEDPRRSPWRSWWRSAPPSRATRR